jgi:hypothetical protein
MTAAGGTEGEDRLIPCLASPVAEELSPKTVDGYRRDLLAFRREYLHHGNNPGHFRSPRAG